MRIEPPISDPVARLDVPLASDAADPPDDPPGVKSGFHGLRVTPQSRVQVTPAQENSGVAVRAWTMPPSAMIRALMVDVWSGTKSWLVSEPKVVRLPAI